MCKESAKEDVAVTIFKHTSTIGIREYKCSRMILNRKIEKVSTQYGDIDVKRHMAMELKNPSWSLKI